MLRCVVLGIAQPAQLRASYIAKRQCFCVYTAVMTSDRTKLQQSQWRESQACDEIRAVPAAASGQARANTDNKTFRHGMTLKTTHNTGAKANATTKERKRGGRVRKRKAIKLD